MTVHLPAPLTFELPDGWRPVSPDQADASGTAFVALYSQPDAGFTANITIDGAYRHDAATLSDIAQEPVEHLHQSTSSSIEVSGRQEAGTTESPSLTQTLLISAPNGDSLVQAQVYLSTLDVVDSRKRFVIHLILTSTASQHSTVVKDFRHFVSTIRPDTDGDF